MPKHAPRRKFWARQALAERDRLFAADPRCRWCGVTARMGKGHGGQLATLDHVKSWPECSGVQEWSSPENMALACRECNERRGREWCLKNHTSKK